MGSEHSTQNPAITRQTSVDSTSQRTSLGVKRQYTIATPGGSTGDDSGRPGSISPGPSVCSDIDLPYISYTVNRPIGDSPKLTNKQVVKAKPQRKPQQKPVKKTAHNIVVVKPAASGPSVEKDLDILRLQSIPMFLPIMRATLNLPAARDPEILERLDPVPLQKFCARYQTHLTACANLVATEQNALTQRIREIDADVTRIVNAAYEKQKRFARHAEKLAKVQELSHQLNRCHMLLNQTLESIETLNDCLAVGDRLEPFVWTTG